MTYALEDFADTCRNVPINPKSMQALEFVERAKDTARRNGQLLLRLAHFTPRPLRGYGPPSAPPRPAQWGEDRLAAGQAGEGNEAHVNAYAVESVTAAAPMPNRNPTRERGVTPAEHPQPTSANPPLPSPWLTAATSPERERVGPAFTNPTRKRGATDARKAQPTLDYNAELSPSPASTSPERERAGVFTPASRAPPTKAIPVPLTISARAITRTASLHETTTCAHHPPTGPPRPDAHRVSHN